MSSIASTAPYASLALMLGAFVIFGGIWRSKLGIVLTIGVAVLNYLQWRIFDTIPWGGTFSELWWPVTCLVVEVLALFDASILLAILARPTNRSAEADKGEAQLRALWQENAQAIPPVDVFIATYNEPREVLEKTILGCLAMDWPDARVWVLDDGRRPWVRDICEAKGAGYITRADNKGAKAGNINHGLTLTDAPYVAVFDADFVPQRNFLMRTMGFFENPKIGIVQIPHSFYNHDPMQTNLGLQQAMPDDQRFFFEAIMPGRDGWDASFCCGSNSVTRRTIFDEIGGGLPEGSITEDMLLTLASLRKGYITRYLNEPLAYGLAPESTAAFFVQRQRWAQGAIQILYLSHGPLGRGLKLRYRFLFLPTAWLTQGLQSAFTIFVPILFALFNMSPMIGVDLPGIIFYLLPMVAALLGGITLLAPGRYYPLAAQILTVFQTFRILPAALKTVLFPKGLTFKVTPKGSSSGSGTGGACGSVLMASLILVALSLASLAINMLPDYRVVAQDGLLPVVAFWLAFNMLMLILVAMMCLEKPRVRGEERFAVRHTVTLVGAQGEMISSSRGDISISGLGMAISDPVQFAVGDRGQIVLPEVGIVRGFIRYSSPQRLGVEFDFHSEELRDRLIVSLFTNGMDVNALRPSALAVAGSLVKRLWSADLSLRPQIAIPAQEPEPAVEKLSAIARLVPPGRRPDLRAPDLSVELGALAGTPETPAPVAVPITKVA